MPDKRQESKQRRAARNRANREALAARRENVGAASAAPTGKASGDPKAGSAGSARGARSAASGSATSTPNTATSTGRRPGELALWAALVLAVAGALAMIFVLKVPVDDRGEVVPTGPGRLGGLTLAAREAVTGEPVPDRDVSYVDAYGMGGVIPTAVPIALAAFAVWASRRQDRSRLLTYAMLGMAVAVLFGGGLFFYPALIFVAIGGFLARRADLPARAAERAARTTAPRGGAGGGGLFGQGGLFGGGRSRGTVIDADSEDVTDESPERTTARDRPAEDQVADVADDDEAASDTSDDTPVDKPVDKADPLAELEAELEAERAAEDADDRTRRER